MKTILAFIAVLVLLSACRSTRKITTAIAKKDISVATKHENSAADSLAYIQTLLRRVDSNNINFKTFTAKVNIDYKDASNKSYNVNATLRMYKDSALWISANAILGIEALRVLVTKDSVKILDKLNKVYTARSIEYLQDVADMPLDLATMQDLIIGNPIFVDSVVSYGHVPTNTITLLSIGEWFKHLMFLSESNKALLRSKIDDIDPTYNRTADITYLDYDNSKGVMFSTKRRINISGTKKLDIKLDFRQYDLGGSVSFPFNIPKNYKRN